MRSDLVITEFRNIYTRHHIYSWGKNDKIFELVVNDFLRRFPDENFSIGEYFNAYSGFKQIKEQIKSRSNYYTNALYEILLNYKYNTKEDIIDAIDLICDIKNSVDLKNVGKIINSPVVESANYDSTNKKFQLYSPTYGEINFERASDYFNDNKDIVSYIENTYLVGACHKCTYFFVSNLKENYAITAFCELPFVEHYYHSFVEMQDGEKIADIRYNLVMKVDDYFKLFNPIIIKKTSGYDLEREINNMKRRYIYNREYSELVNLALKEQIKTYKKS